MIENNKKMIYMLRDTYISLMLLFLKYVYRVRNCIDLSPICTYIEDSCLHVQCIQLVIINYTINVKNESIDYFPRKKPSYLHNFCAHSYMNTSKYSCL